MSAQESPVGGATTVLLVDDERLIRGALSQALTSSGLDVVGEAASGEDALKLGVGLRPDVVLMDLSLPGVSGIEAIGRLGMLAPASRVLVLTRGEQNRVVEAILAGASGYILKSATPEEIVAAVRATAAGECVLSSQVGGRILEHIRGREIPLTVAGQSAAVAIRAALTVRELEILAHLAGGESNQEIARALSLSTNTVSNHIASILAKLHLHNRVQAAVQAVRAGIS
jgi:DNA-binding NarL/FixJ family response regulator